MAKASPILARREILLGVAAVPLLNAAKRASSSVDPRIGLQIFPFIADVQRDLPGTVRQIALTGVKQIELLAGLGSPTTMASALRANDLHVPSVHASATPLFPGVPSLATDFDEVVAYCKTVGAKTLICSTPWLAAPLATQSLDQALAGFGEADWLAHGSFLRRTAALAKTAGLAFAYHNHTAEFRSLGGKTGFDVILASTARDNVAIELDCGWAYAAGADPAKLIKEHADRIRFLHLKDVTRSARSVGANKVRTVPLGRGVIDWRSVLVAARDADVRFAFVEQEPPFERRAIIDAQEGLRFLARLGQHP